MRLQARRYGAGLVFSEMVSSFAVHYRNEKTCRELLRIDPREHEGGAVAIQLFGADPEVMRSAAASGRGRRRRPDRHQHGLPGPEGLPDRRRRRAAGRPRPRRRASRGPRCEGGGLPVTVKLRSGWRAGETDGVALAHRLVDEAGVAAIALHPRPATARAPGRPDYALVASWCARSARRCC